MSEANTRRRKYGKERLSERIIVYLTPTQRDEVEKESGGDVSGYIRQKLFEEVTNSTQHSAELRAAFNTPGDLIGQMMHREIENNPEIQSLVEQYTKNALTIHLTQPIHERITKIAEEVGYADPSQLAKDLIMVVAIKGDDETKEFMFGQAQDAALEAAQERDSSAANTIEERIQKTA